MKRTLLLLSVFMLSVCGTTPNAHAKRGIPIPIVWGSGEKMTDLPPEVANAVADELGTQVTVALISFLPESDDRKVYAQNCLTSVNEKRFANATESSDAPEPEEANQ